MNNNDTTATVSTDHYGTPVAEFAAPAVLNIEGRTFFADSIIWDAEYAAYRGTGFYAKKDGTAGARQARPIMAPAEVPAEIRTQLAHRV